MSLERIPYPNPYPTVKEDYVKQNNLISDSFLRITNPNQFASGNILKGTIIQLGGTVYKATSDTAITGSQSEYVKISKSADGSTATAAYVANLTGVTWSDTYNGYYDGSGNLYLFNEQIFFRKGEHSIQLTEYDTDTVPAIAAGGAVEINGGIYVNLAEVTISGSTSNSTWYDILLAPSGKTFTASFVARGTGTWSESKRGLYSGNNRVIGCVYRDASGDFINKNILNVVNRMVEIKVEMGPWNMDDLDVARTITIPIGIDVLGVRSVTGNIRSDASVNYSINRYSTDALGSEWTSSGVYYMSSGNIYITAEVGGDFDDPAFNDDTINRGHIIVTYEV